MNNTRIVGRIINKSIEEICELLTKLLKISALKIIDREYKVYVIYHDEKYDISIESFFWGDYYLGQSRIDILKVSQNEIDMEFIQSIILTLDENDANYDIGANLIDTNLDPIGPDYWFVRGVGYSRESPVGP